MKWKDVIFMKPLNGMHHVTAITSSAEKIYDFFTHVLGLRLVKKTINQERRRKEWNLKWPRKAHLQ